MTVIIIIIVVLLICFLSFFSKEKTVIKDRQMIELSNEAFLDGIIDLGKNMRVTESGYGMNTAFMYSTVKKAERMVNKKSLAQVPMNEGEKWLYENFYLVYRYIFSQKNKLALLPHVDKIPRIIHIARYIVDKSLNCLNAERVRLALDELTKFLPLTFAELSSLNSALGYAVLEQIYILSKRLLYHENCKKSVKRNSYNEKLMKSDIYAYFYLTNKRLSAEEKSRLEIKGFSTTNILLGYNHTLRENTMMAETLFKALRDVAEYAPLHIGIKYFEGYRYFSKTENFTLIDVATKIDYFIRIERIAQRLKMKEDFVSKKAVELAVKNGVDISEIIYNHKKELKQYIKKEKFQTIKPVNKKPLERLYIFSVLIFSLGLSGLIMVIAQSIVLGIFAILPLIYIAENLLNYLLMCCKDVKITPKMDYKSVPYEHKAMVVISQFIGSIGQFKESLRHAEIIYEGNKDENIQITMLIDTKGGENVASALDSELMSYLDNIRLKSNFNVLIRKKYLCNGKYQGKERKRGAIMALCRCLLTGNVEEFAYISNKNIIAPEYLLCLDEDNTLLNGEILDMVNMMAHPFNKKYDLLATQNKYNLYSLNNAYSRRFYDESGFAGYPYYNGLYNRLFGKDLYCGKGIFRLKRFYNKLEDVLPSNKILSHDILEGAILSTGCGSIIFEDAPNGFLSDRERKKRWERGDIQLLPFIKSFWRNDSKNYYKTEISPIYKYIMLKNAFSPLKDICLLIILLIGGIMGVTSFFSALGVFLLPYCINEIKILRGITFGTRFRYIISSTIKNIGQSIEDFFMIGYYGISNLAVFLSTLSRMICGKKLLEWKTYYNSQNKNEFSSYIKEFSVPFVIQTLAYFILSIFYAYNMIFFGVYLMLCIPIYLELYIASRIKSTEHVLAKEDISLLHGYAEKTYRYFSYMRSQNGIISDNLQIKPYKGASKTTSPTNIGFSLIAEICAYNLEINTLEESLYNISKIIDGIEKLPKWYGNLYNWYDVDKLVQVNEFVSSVDSGNFLVALLLTKEFCYKNCDITSKIRLEMLINKTDLKKLYDSNKNQFYLGYDGNKYCGHYDLLASEARILSTVFIALYRNKSHFFALERDYTSYKGNTLLSWSGTSFEYLMAELFFDAPYKSLINNTSKNACRAQMSRKVNGVWGIGESGYYAFDDEMKYQYHAFGIKKLSLRNEKERAVISPYSSILCLKFFPEETIKNLRALENKKCLFEYGFYESIEYSENQNIIASYMTHHQGMILCALTNLLAKNTIIDLLNNDEKISSALNFYNELPSKRYYGYKTQDKQRKITTIKEYYYKNINNLEQYLQNCVISDAQYGCRFNSFGQNYSYCGNIMISKYTSIYTETEGGFFAVSEGNNQWYSPTYLPFKTDASHFEFCFTDKEIVFTNIAKNLKQHITLVGATNTEIRKLQISGDVEKVAFYMPITLSSFDGYFAHPCFNDLFVKAYVNDKNLLILHKRSLKKSGDYFLGVRVEGLCDIRYECNRGNFCGRNRELSNAEILFDDYQKIFPSMGDVLSPCIGFIGNVCNDKSCQVGICFGESEEYVTKVLTSLPNNMYGYALESVQKYSFSALSQDIATELLYSNFSNKQMELILKNNEIDMFNAFNNGRKSICYAFNNKNIEDFETFLQVLVDLRIMRIPVKLAIEIKDDSTDDIVNFIKSSVKDIFSECEILSVDDKKKNYVFMNISENLHYSKTRYISSKLFEISNNECATDIKCILPNFIQKSGFGGFIGKNAYCQNSDNPTYLPYSIVVADDFGGFIKTTNGGGYYYFGNSRENKMTRFDNDYVSDRPSEMIYVKTLDGYMRLNGGKDDSKYCILDGNSITFHSKSRNVYSEVKEYMICDGKVKILEITLDNSDGGASELVFGLYPSLDWVFLPHNISYSFDGDILTIINFIKKTKLYVRFMSKNPNNLIPIGDKEIFPYFDYCTEVGKEKIFIISTQDYNLCTSLTPDKIKFYREKQEIKRQFLNKISIDSPFKSFDFIVNFLPWQVYNSRLKAKSGFYQVGGATGFRDQLQDSLAFLHNFEITREQILYSAKRQYVQGDVMHWWHEPKYGLRTRITDDKLFLPYAVCEYLKFSGDLKLLDVELPYLNSVELDGKEESRFENPPFTDFSESIFKHCLRAIRSALKYGEHRLLVMGKGDWNDGMDDICAVGKGESVFNSMFAYMILREFASFCPDNLKNELIRISEELKLAINLHAFEKDRYKRLFSDDGRWLGGKGCTCLELDLLVQSFAVISGVSEDKTDIVLNTAKELIDYNAGIIKLLSPPLDRTSYLGYISAYAKGIRENGGQYTHAAIWYLYALSLAGRQNEAFELFQMINPAEKCTDSTKNSMYMGEPYVFSGDVYANNDNYGRCGWSWYTGSAGWAYRLVVEVFFGLKLRDGNILVISPKLPSKLHGTVINYRFGDALYEIEYQIGNENSVIYNGVKVENGIELSENGGGKIIVTQT